MSKASHCDNSERHTKDATAIVIYQSILGSIDFPEGYLTSPLTQILSADGSIERVECVLRLSASKHFLLCSFCIGKRILLPGWAAACAGQYENGEDVSHER